MSKNNVILAKLQNAYHAYNDRLRSEGKKLLGYKCPHCEAELETQRATRGDTWDTLATCPFCGGLYMRWTTHYSVRTQVPKPRRNEA